MIPIATERLFLDRFYPDDWVNRYKMELSPEQHRYQSETFNPQTESEIKYLINKLIDQDYNNKTLPFILAVRLKTTKEFIGFIGLKNGGYDNKLENECQVEVYFSIFNDYWSKGYGTEALRAIIAFGFQNLKLHRIFAGCDIENIASKSIMEKAGMRFETFWRKDRKRNGKWTDGFGFSILDEDFI
ncbi:GNAT family N-acetyltransferase [Oceanispirochaeta sp. M2]|nr:GNAT family N-acetyltransferase [Oceanispirochaeta sp. M2]NPD75432.1 GNAT family N-acetyltransferase [Oceanispirochaeta sp. M1]RDG28719.1 N-acetyltransferase [Oceanispirochaeta sp. M1]